MVQIVRRPDPSQGIFQALNFFQNQDALNLRQQKLQAEISQQFNTGLTNVLSLAESNPKAAKIAGQAFFTRAGLPKDQTDTLLKSIDALQSGKQNELRVLTNFLKSQGGGIPFDQFPQLLYQLAQDPAKLFDFVQNLQKQPLALQQAQANLEETRKRTAALPSSFEEALSLKSAGRSTTTIQLPEQQKENILDEAFLKQFGKGIADRLGVKLPEDAAKAAETVGRIQQGLELNRQIDTGALSDLKRIVGGVLEDLGIPLFEGKEIANLQQLTALFNNLAFDKLGGRLGAQISDPDREFIRTFVPKATNVNEANEFLLKSMLAVSSKKLIQEEFVNNAISERLDPRRIDAISRKIDATPVIGRNKKSKQVVHFNDFVDAFKEQRPDSDIDTILNSWRKFYSFGK